MPEQRHEINLPRGVDAPALARAALEEWFGRELPRDELDATKLLSTELVTNALDHGKGGIHLQTSLDNSRLRVEVVDEGPPFEHHPRAGGFDKPGGRGLMIVGALSSRWGIRRGDSAVWFEIERPAPPSAAAGLE